MSVSFLTLLTDLAVQGNVPLDDVTGMPDVPLAQEHRYAAYLNTGLSSIWRRWGRSTLEETLAWGTVTLGTDGVIAAPDIERSDFWNVWSSDPREVDEPRREALQLRAGQLSGGGVKVYDKAAGSTVFVFWRKPVPVFSAIRALSTRQAGIDARRWNFDGDAVCGAGDGHCYRNVSGEATQETGFDDASVWEAITLPANLQDVAVRAGLYQRAIAEKDGNAIEYWSADFEMKCDELVRRQESKPGSKLWLYHAGA